MADRVVKVTLLAQVQGYLAGMDQAARKTRELSQDSVARLAQQRQAYESLGRTALAVGTLAVAGAALAIAKFAEFDQAMSEVAATTQESAENMERLRDAALEAGGRTVYTATEAANAIEQLGRNGLSTAQILGGGLDAALDLAAAGGLDLARAAEIAAITTKQFGLAGRDIPQIADLLAAGAGKAAGDVEDLAQALSQAGLVAAQTGVSVEETTGTLAAFADAGLLGSDAGTSLRTMLLRLTPSSKEAEKAMRELGITAFDSQGEFIGLENFAGVLQKRLGGLTTEQRNLALTTIFGQDAIRGANRLYDLGADGLREYIDATNDSGYAARVAADRLDNLRGDVEKLGGAFDTLLIQQGSGVNDFLRGVTQSLTFLVDAAAGLPPATVNIGLVAGAVLAIGGAVVSVVPKIGELRTALDILKISGRTAGIALGGVTAALTVVTILIGEYVAKQAESAAATDSFRESLDATTGDLTEYSRELIRARLEAKGLFDDNLRTGGDIRVTTLKDLGVTQRELTDAVYEGGDAYAALIEKLRQVERDSNSNDSVARNLRISLGEVNEELALSRDEWEEQARATYTGTRATEASADALAELEGQAIDTSGAIDDLSNQILNFGKATLDTRDANRQFESAIDELTESVKENGRVLDVGTDAGRANEEAIDALAEASKKRAAAILLETGSQENATAALQQGRDALIAQLAQFGIVGAEAEAYADRLGLIPASIETVATIKGVDEIDTRLGKLFAKYGGLTFTAKLEAMERMGFASGGYTGNMPATSVAGVVHGREFVTNAAATSIPANRQALEFMNAGGNISGFMGGYLPAATASTSTVTKNFTLNANGVDPLTVTQIWEQQMAAKLATIG